MLFSRPEFPQKHSVLVESLVDTLAMVALLLFLISYFPPSLVLSDTLTVGGDTPAHNYLASHLKESLLEHGRIISWANGWWCGFPMFQYYFCLPYLMTAVLSLIIPFNIALKLTSVSGIFALPLCSYLAGKLARQPRPVPTLMAIASIPFLFVKTHTIWGANVYSMLSGMISNSLSFPFFVLFVASSYRDVQDGAFRHRTTLFLVATLASHFFTSIAAMLTVSVLPLLHDRKLFLRNCMLIARTCGLGLLLMAWWLVPLMAKGEFTSDYGTNWNVSLLSSMPPYVWWLSPLAVVAIYHSTKSKQPFSLVILWMLAVALFLFFAGFRISHAFVNVRIWPFIFYALITLEVIGLGVLVSDARGNWLVVAALLVIALSNVEKTAQDVRVWVRWGYEGVEKKPLFPVLEGFA